ncbi:MAG: helix-turn-helix transcriptional regulator, partial [Gammaproteobacteria bacterium]|nr:helix-turn-helix transcriptional regulator [Gammaproteobacteria bacterium]
MSLIAGLSQNLAEILPGLGSGDFCPALVNTIRALVPVDEVSIIVYESGSMPVIDFADPAPDAQPNIGAFLKGAFLLDPYYIAATKHQRSGFFQLRDLVPTAFEQSEYYRVYYRHSELHDECGYLVPINDGGFVNIELGRFGTTEFSGKDLQVLRDISPLVSVLCDLHWRKKQRNDKRETRLRGQLESALANFGGSVLTKRE